MDANANYAGSATSLGESTDHLEAEGFTGQFAAREAGQVLCFTCRQESPAMAFEAEALRRTEGASDPADMTAVVAMSCPQCQTKGTLVVHYGAQMTPEEAEVLRAIEDDRSAGNGGMQAGED